MKNKSWSGFLQLQKVGERAKKCFAARCGRAGKLKTQGGSGTAVHTIFSVVWVRRLVLGILCTVGCIWVFCAVLGAISSLNNKNKVLPDLSIPLKTVTLDADTQLRSVQIGWLAGTVKILGYEGDSVKIEVFGSQEMPAEQDALVYGVSGKTLQIDYDDALLSVDMGFGVKQRRALVLYLPASVLQGLSQLSVTGNAADVTVENLQGQSAVKITTTSADIAMQNINVRLLQLSTQNGSIRADQVSAVSLQSKTVFGSTLFTGAQLTTLDVRGGEKGIYYNGSCSYVQAATVCGNIELLLTQTQPAAVCAESDRGDITLSLPQMSGFLLRHAGKLQNEFSMQSSGKLDTYLDGTALLELSTVYGTISLKNSEA